MENKVNKKSRFVWVFDVPDACCVSLSDLLNYAYGSREKAFSAAFDLGLHYSLFADCFYFEHYKVFLSRIEVL